MTFEEELRRSGRLVFTNKGISMMPLLRQNKDIMVIEACESGELRPLDAVLFIRETAGKKNYVLHRILKENPDGSYWIVGDNCFSGENVKREQIIGRLTAVVRDGRTISVEDKKYLLYVHLWCDFYPLRFLILRSRYFWRRGVHFIKRRIFHEK